MDISRGSRSKFGQIRHGSKVMMVSKGRAVGRSENPGGQVSTYLVMLRTQSGIGLTDLPIVYWGGCPLAPPRSDGPVRGSNFLNLRFAYKL